MRSAFDFAPFRRSTVGFDRLFDMLENNGLASGGENYPPFDLIRTGENDYRIELAVAGFKPDEIDITAQQNVLVVTGKKKEESDEKGSDYIYRGIATRSFERRFALADHIQVRGADMKDGLLSIELVREIPEAMTPRKIDIGASAKTDKLASGQTVDAKAEHDLAGFFERLLRQRHQRERAALSVVVGAQQQRDIFQRNDKDQRPDEQRNDADDLGLSRPRARVRAAAMSEPLSGSL